ncbi:hypothetical protein [Rhodobacter sp. CZR27]|uniref:hypothetical protein n=1 Tax=Rhodobacter sp. CZR27 TaxID=2033869 RepID=UPI000BBE2388|nr:hypothetical protein [Rhodobacter sp. CZR27]
MHYDHYLRADLPRPLSLTIGLFCAEIVLVVLLALSLFGLALVFRAESNAHSMSSTLDKYAARTLEVAELVSEEARDHIERRGSVEGLDQDRPAHVRFAQEAAAALRKTRFARPIQPAHCCRSQGHRSNDRVGAVIQLTTGLRIERTARVRSHRKQACLTYEMS